MKDRPKIVKHLLFSCKLSYSFNFFITINDFITFANSSDPDQDRQNIGYDVDPNSSSLW